MLNKFVSNNILILSSFLVILIFLFYSFFYASVIRTVEEDELIKKGFDAKAYVENIWESKIITTISEEAEDITFILDELFKNKEVTEENYGGRSGTGSYSFMIKGKAEITSLNTASRVGTLSIKLEKQYDSEIFITLGPVIKKDSIRDAVKFIKFND